MDQTQELIACIEQCELCKSKLAHAPRPVVSFAKNSKILIIGQAPGSKVHASGVPWDDQSGKNLRTWLGVDEATFYKPELFGIIPMGFCYPGKGKSGDLPPLKECAPTWHPKILNQLQEVKLTLLIGQYAQNYYLNTKKESLTERIKNFDSYLPQYFVLPHPSPRNRFWLAKNKWFESEVLPILKMNVSSILNEDSIS